LSWESVRRVRNKAEKNMMKNNIPCFSRHLSVILFLLTCPLCVSRMLTQTHAAHLVLYPRRSPIVKHFISMYYLCRVVSLTLFHKSFQCTFITFTPTHHHSFSSFSTLLQKILLFNFHTRI
jgi:hypothetical protein